MRKLVGHLAILAAAFLLPLTGCAEKWTKPGATDADFKAADSTCMAAALARHPPDLSQNEVMPAVVSQSTLVGDAQAGTCQFTGGGEVAPAVTITADANQDARLADWRACLRASGWQPAKE